MNFVWALAIIIVFEIIIFAIAMFRRRNDMADVGWGIGFSIVAIFIYAISKEKTWPQQVLMTLVICWSCRLSGYLIYRTSNTGEDHRYLEMKKNWGAHWIIKSFLYVFILQGVLLWALCLGLIQFMSEPPVDMNFQQWLAALICVFGICYEGLADYQKSQFKKSNSSPQAFIRSGLFKYSRYPQYFGEMTFWFGVFVFGAKLDYTLAFIASPIMLALLLRYVSGVPLLEKKYRTRPGYLQYAEHTSLFIPFLG